MTRTGATSGPGSRRSLACLTSGSTVPGRRPRRSWPTPASRSAVPTGARTRRGSSALRSLRARWPRRRGRCLAAAAAEEEEEEKELGLFLGPLLSRPLWRGERKSLGAGAAAAEQELLLPLPLLLPPPGITFSERQQRRSPQPGRPGRSCSRSSVLWLLFLCPRRQRWRQLSCRRGGRRLRRCRRRRRGTRLPPSSPRATDPASSNRSSEEELLLLLCRLLRG